LLLGDRQPAVTQFALHCLGGLGL